jgi:hypothetical protein
MKHYIITMALKSLVLTALINTAYSTPVVPPLYSELQSYRTLYQTPVIQPTFITLDASSLVGKDIQALDLSHVSSIDLSGVEKVDEIIDALVQNKTVRVLQRLDLSNSKVSLAALKKLREIKPEHGFIRPIEKVSGRSGHQIACIEVSISGTDLAKDPDSRWELNNDVQRPVIESVDTFYLATQEWGKPHLQIIPLF